MKFQKSATAVYLILIAAGIAALFFGVQASSFQKEGRKFGLVCMTMNNEFYEVIQSELYSALSAKSDELITLDPQLNLEKQIEQIYWLIDQKVDGLFINPMDSEAIADPVQKAREQGIPVIILDAPLNDETRAISTIASNNTQAGQLCALHMMETLLEAKIGLLKHSEVESASERINSFLNEIEGRSEYEVVDSRECQGQLELAMPQAESMLKEHPDIQVIMALNDPSAMGALAALESLGRKDVLVYGVDGTPDVKKQISQNSSMCATAAQSPVSMAELAAKTMYNWLDTKTCPDEQILDVYLITRDNIDSYSLQGWQ